MASIYEAKPYALIQIPDEDQASRCRMCLEVAKPSDGIDLGPLYEYGHPVTLDKGKSTDVEIYRSHYFCLLFSSGLEQKSEMEDVGIKGFLPKDMLKEWRRGQRLKCSGCGKNYATVGCSHSKCQRTFHLSCAIRSQALLQFTDRFCVYCRAHRTDQRGVFSPVTTSLCNICYDDIENEQNKLWSPCCDNWFHKGCVQRLADSSGYFFKCPLCNNKEDFEHEMKSFGIYVPERDAAWELDGEGQQFEALLERHGSCDAKRCICPEGRKKDEDYTEWEIMLCRCCGAQGIHVACGGLALSGSVKWSCDTCKETISKLPPRTIHRFKPISRKKSSNKSNWSRLMKDVRIVVVGPKAESLAVHVYGGKQETTSLPKPRYTVSGSIRHQYDMPQPVRVRREDIQDAASPSKILPDISKETDHEEKRPKKRSSGSQIASETVPAISAQQARNKPVGRRAKEPDRGQRKIHHYFGTHGPNRIESD